MFQIRLYYNGCTSKESFVSSETERTEAGEAYWFPSCQVIVRGYIGKENMDWHWILVVFENCITKKMFSCQLFLRHVELLLLMLLVYVRIGTTWMGLLFLFWSFELDGILLYYCWKFWVILEIVPLWLYDINFYIRKLSASGGIFCC